MKVKNFKLFKDRTFTFNEKFTLIIGENGTGKTSILDALCVGMGGFLSGIERVSSRNILKDEIRLERDKLGDASVTIEPQFPAEVCCKGIIDNQNIEWKRSKNTVKGHTTRIEAKEIIKISSDMEREIVTEKNHNVTLPIISYQSAGRLFSQKKSKWSNPFDKGNLSRFIGYTDCLDTESNIKLFVSWLKRMSLIKVQKGKEIGELNAVLNAVKEFMRGMLEEETDPEIYFDFEEQEVIFQTATFSLPLRMLSAGYRSLIGMVADIAYRMAVLNPQLKEDASKKTPGVILIDEIDLHIHPKWQWQIVEDLKRTFPRVQFIATTHSPIVISSVDRGEIISIYDEENRQNGLLDENKRTPFGWHIEDILTEIMGTDYRMPIIEAKIENVQRLYMKKLSKGISKQEEEDLQKQSKELYDLLPESDPAVTLSKIDVIGERALGENKDD